MEQEDLIIRDPKIMLGKPIYKGTRLTVELILRKLADGLSPEEISTLYPNITEEHLKATYNYCAEIISNELLIRTS
ncbi:DUF433 domain-containing protein [Rapidithrix thailandica]|uniref:DUF433 domain-containing protein n=1 Tax=Rapidithrix thailandica TaxID=413964 RepID=A0AAW9SCN5_9BACT